MNERWPLPMMILRSVAAGVGVATNRTSTARAMTDSSNPVTNENLAATMKH
eukprot:CAMPEP_0201141104 /NCGR_PEP_ID=MMETSP0851-20130426/2683_1 /ASSEMBLY_ACC=CAM_ASM_000631 /TAXON_ID=183588 /ORGANISM="Pseudo-nitzschia fraudulenta, Strain WWA7" /LENGTH=50 /DNA_ID=CAMNT_0047414001 /DNA_START=73 /DNA_END=222 /DNA_ORIENTATION=-